MAVESVFFGDFRAQKGQFDNEISARRPSVGLLPHRDPRMRVAKIDGLYDGRTVLGGGFKLGIGEFRGGVLDLPVPGLPRYHYY